MSEECRAVRAECVEISFNYKTRLVDELTNLVEKITLLEKALQTLDVTKQEEELMHRQLEYMYGYKAMLTDRLYVVLQ